MPTLTITMSQDAADRLTDVLTKATSDGVNPLTLKQYVIADLKQLVKVHETREATITFVPNPIELT